MSAIRHIIVCEGDSEWAYLQRLQGFLDAQPLPKDVFETPLRFIGPKQAVAKNGSFGKLRTAHNRVRKQHKRTSSIQIWADFDLYHRNDKSCATQYTAKTDGIPDFLFSFHNFEDFFALHWSGAQFKEWIKFGKSGHFVTPLHADRYLPQIERIFPNYKKGALPPDFITWDSLKNLKQNKACQPISNPHDWQPLLSFADFLISEIEKAFPGSL